jgi:hypothetical protein
MSARALFVTSFHQSLGETFTLGRFAADLRAEGWRTEFLASEFAAGFLREQGNTLELFTASREGNQRLLDAALRRVAPDLIVASDFFLFEATDARRMWSVRWLTESGVPVVTFDHLKFHPDARTITLGFKSRFDSDPALLANFPGVPAGATPRATVAVPALPAEVVALIRPCPVHDPRSQPDPRLRCYDLTRSESKASPPTAARRRLGISDGEKVVVVPVGSWALGLARHVRLPYPDLLGQVLLRYFGRAAGRVRVLLVGKGLEAAKHIRGRVTLELIPGLPFDELQDLLAAADLVLGDNATSATLGRAVMAGVPAAVLVSSLRVRREPAGLVLDAPFPLSRFARGLIESTEQSAPGSVFPFAVYPLGWREEMEPLFDGNPYRDAIEWLEMFHETDSAERLVRIVFEPAARERLMARQMAYRQLVEALPDAAEIVAGVLARAEGAVA